jgi:hypothetical protein
MLVSQIANHLPHADGAVTSPGVTHLRDTAEVVPTDDEFSSHALIGDGGKVRVMPAGRQLAHQGSEIHSKDG